MNCSQAVLKTFQQRYALSEAVIEEFKQHGSGRAPDGLCGALYAAVSLAGEHFPEKQKDLEAVFCAAAGSKLCKEIRAQRTLSCQGCIEQAVALIERFGGSGGNKEGK